MTAPLLWLPDAQRVPHPRPFPWQTNDGDPKGCLHTTETIGPPGYDGWTIMPHGDVLPHPGKGVTIRQFLPLDQGSFALRHTRAQPTGGDRVYQWELIGTCDPSRHDGAYRWFEADDAVLLDLYLKLIKPLDLAYVIPFKALEFRAYPYPAGTNRLTDAQFDTYTGWLGHQHVPQNDHGDPGAFPWARMAALAARHDGDDDMPTADEIAKAVWDHQLPRPWDSAKSPAGAMLGSAQRYAIEAGAATTRPNTKPAEPTQAQLVLNRLDELETAIRDVRQLVAGLTPPASS